MEEFNKIDCYLTSSRVSSRAEIFVARVEIAKNNGWKCTRQGSEGLCKSTIGDEFTVAEINF